MPDDVCSILPWDSAFFGLKIARVVPSSLTQDITTQALAWCRSNGIDCLYLLAASDHPETMRLAEGAGFGLVDIRMNLGRHAGDQERNPPPNESIRLYKESDLEVLEQIAASSHEDSRFFSDGRFPQERCRALFQTWIQRSCNGWAQAVFVAEVDGVPAGYCTCHLDGNSGSIGLVALAPQAQGRALGRSLVDTALSYFRQHGVNEVAVATQGRNYRAQRLYQKCGFVTQSVMLWYHKWWTDDTISSQSGSTGIRR